MTQGTMFQRFLGRESVKQGQPLELISYDSEKKCFEVGKEALEVLRNVRAPIGVISVCGRARQGKSFILNQLLGQSSGFTVAPTHRPCTKGLWMWSTPQERLSSDGSKYYLVQAVQVMLDTEGIDAWDQTGQYSVQIFSLAVLLSSLFVYNQMGGIDEAAVDRLSLVTEMTKHIRVRASQGNSSESELGEFTPSFLWLLRDFYLQLEEDGRTVSPREYLETALSAVPAISESAKSKNRIRESIKSLFPDRDCFPLVRPISDEGKLSRLETVPMSQLRPEFREGLSKLTALCFSKAQPKRMGNNLITGPLLSGLVTAYVEAINKGAVPNIATAWQGVAEVECRRAAESAEQLYRSTFNQIVDADPEALLKEHQRALQAAKALYDEGALGDASIKDAVEQKWRGNVDQVFTSFRDKRLAEASQAVVSLLHDMGTKLTMQASDSDCSVQDIMAGLKVSLQEYIAQAQGPTKWPKLVDHLQHVLSVIVKRLQEDSKKSVAAAEVAAAGLKTELASVRSEVSRLRAAVGSEESKARALEVQLEAAHQKAASDVERVRKELQAESASQLQSVENKFAALEMRAASVEAERSSVGDQLKQAEGVRQSLQRQLEEVTLRLQHEQARAVDVESKGQMALSSAEEQLKVLGCELVAERARVADLVAERDAQNAAIEQLQQEVANGVAELARQAQERLDEEMPLADDPGMATPGTRLAAQQFTIQEIKEWLIENGFEDECWALANRRTPRVKKADWVDLMNSKQ